MRVYDAKNIRYRDKLTEKRRRVWILKALFFVGLVIAVIVFILYLLFFSSFLEIKEVSIKGLDKVNSNEFNDKLNKRLNSKLLGLFEFQRNLIFFNSDNFKAEMLAVFPEIKDISVSKEPLHALNIVVMEREIAGVWCFVDDRDPAKAGALSENCKYFDKDGFAWGEAARSSGFLILAIDDMRQNTREMFQRDATQVDRELLKNIMFISTRLKEVGILVSKFIFPDDYIGDFTGHVVSNGHAMSILFSTDSDIKGQIEVLDIFLADKKDDSDFNPQYIDLRINGRIYYK